MNTSSNKVSSSQYISLEKNLGANNYNPLDIIIDHAQGVWVYDVEGNKYLDCLSAYSAVNQGHCHPKILKTLKEQAEKVTLTSRAFRNPKLPLFYKELSELTGAEMILPMNSGAEAVETAIKAARKWGYKIKGIEQDKAEIIVCANNFHGRTTTSDMTKEKIIEWEGIYFYYLPPFSPELNYIENKWNILKHHSIPKKKFNNQNELDAAIMEGITKFNQKT